MFHRFHIKPPAAKRMLGSGICIIISDDWCSCMKEQQQLSPGQTSTIIETDDDVEWAPVAQWNDGPVFRAYVQYSNESGSRSEKMELDRVSHSRNKNDL